MSFVCPLAQVEASHHEALRSISSLHTTINDLTATKVLAESLALTLQAQSDQDVKELAASRLALDKAQMGEKLRTTHITELTTRLQRCEADSHAVHTASAQQMAADSALIMACQTRLSEVETVQISEKTNYMKEIGSLQVEMQLLLSLYANPFVTQP